MSSYDKLFIKTEKTVIIGENEAFVSVLKKKYEENIIKEIYNEKLLYGFVGKSIQEQLSQCRISASSLVDTSQLENGICIGDFEGISKEWRFSSPLSQSPVKSVLVTEGEVLVGIYVHNEILWLGGTVEYIGEYWYEGDNNGAGYKEGCYATKPMYMSLLYLPSLITDNETFSHQFDKDVEEITVKEGTERIGAFTFEGFEKLLRVRLPSTLKEIEVGAFKGCVSLKSIEIPKGVEKLSGSTFYGCTGLERVVLPREDIAVGDWCFYECISLKEIVNSQSITAIGDYAFSDCHALEKIELSRNCSGRIGSGVFSKCESLKKIEIPKGIYKISKYSFSECNSLEEISIQNKSIIIEESAFLLCDKIKSVTIPREIKDDFENAVDEEVLPNIKFTLVD